MNTIDKTINFNDRLTFNDDTIAQLAIAQYIRNCFNLIDNFAKENFFEKENKQTIFKKFLLRH